LDGLYPTGTTCSGKSGQVYTSSYDAWGNVTSRFSSGITATLSYDKLDHFVMWDVGSINREWYIYDAGGSRVLRRSTNSSTTLTVYAFGLEEHVYSSSGSNQSNAYYYTLGGRLIGELNGSATQFLLTDALGSVLASVSNVAGSAAVQGNQVYGPYGKQRYKFGTLGTSKGFTGQYNDSLTGLDYYNARYYDPKVGVFLSADTVEGNGVGMNPYAYVGGNPETYSDPTGERIIDPETGQMGPRNPINVDNVPGAIVPCSGCSQSQGGGTSSSLNAFNPDACSQVGCKSGVYGQAQTVVSIDPAAGVGSSTLGCGQTVGVGLFCSLGQTSTEVATRPMYVVDVPIPLVFCSWYHCDDENGGSDKESDKEATEVQMSSDAGGTTDPLPPVDEGSLQRDEGPSGQLASIEQTEGESSAVNSENGSGPDESDDLNNLRHELRPTLDRINRGERFPHRNDGSIFGNREGRLPQRPYGYYREYVHPTPGVEGPGAQRLVIGQEGEIYYTPDHYRTFILLP
jgi:RHS repeat-associated protein